MSASACPQQMNLATHRCGEELPWPFAKIVQFALGVSRVVMGQRICPLCQITKDLMDFRKSHFIPAGLYHSGKKGLQYGTRSRVDDLERHIKDLLLCSTCERLLDEGGESYVLSHIAAKVTDDFPLHRALSLALPRESYPDISRFSGDDLGINLEKFAHFALGIVWRATIHDWTMPDGTLLSRQAIGDFEPPIRRYLLGGPSPRDTSIITLGRAARFPRFKLPNSPLSWIAGPFFLCIALISKKTTQSLPANLGSFYPQYARSLKKPLHVI